MVILIRIVTTGEDIKYHNKVYRAVLRAVEKCFNNRPVHDSEKKRTRSGNGFRQYIIVN